MKRLLALIVLGICAHVACAQEFEFPRAAASDEAVLAKAIPELARAVLARYREESRETYLTHRFRLQLAAGDYAAAVETSKAHSDSVSLRIYALAKLIEAEQRVTFEQGFAQAFREVFAALDDRAALDYGWRMGSPLSNFRPPLAQALKQRESGDRVGLADALELIRAHVFLQAFQTFSPFVDAQVAADDERRYFVEDTLIRTKDGATLSALVMRKKSITAPMPAALYMHIYANDALGKRTARMGAVRGYAGVVVDSRGKRRSPDAIWPWETEGRDANGVIDWISRQRWSSGQVGMFGGSYTGFTQWAAVKHPHPALKTIVPYVATHPGLGLPMENNVFVYPNYAWNFYVMNNKYLDEALYADPRWRTLNRRWYESGRPYRQIDQVDGTPNPLLQKHLQHPSFDAYWQKMTVYGKEFANVRIPVLSITGYFDNANVPTLWFMKEHLHYNPKAEHYLVIGPYDHPGAQAAGKPPFVQGYRVDPVSQFDTEALTYDWFDHVMRGAPRPAFLKDRINFEVMGANEWRHAPSLEAMSTETLTLYLSDAKSGDRYRLSSEKPQRAGFLEQTVDLADRSTMINLYPDILSDSVPTEALAFVSEPFDAPVSVNGTITAMLRATIDKKDMDVALSFYEMMPNGQYFTLGDYVGRASYAHDMTRRKLLTPGKPRWIPIERTPPTSRQMAKGSRLLVLLAVNKNQWAQVNHGTGKDVSDESVTDAGQPLHVKWHNDSYVRVPIAR